MSLSRPFAASSALIEAAFRLMPYFSIGLFSPFIAEFNASTASFAVPPYVADRSAPIFTRSSDLSAKSSSPLFFSNDPVSVMSSLNELVDRPTDSADVFPKSWICCAEPLNTASTPPTDCSRSPAAFTASPRNWTSFVPAIEAAPITAPFMAPLNDPNFDTATSVSAESFLSAAVWASVADVTPLRALATDSSAAANLVPPPPDLRTSARRISAMRSVPCAPSSRRSVPAAAVAPAPIFASPDDASLPNFEVSALSFDVAPDA